MDIKRSSFCWFIPVVFLILITVNIVYSVSKNEPEGLSFWPMPDSNDLKNTLIYYDLHDRDSVLKWITLTDTFLNQNYKNSTSWDNLVACSFTSGPRGEKQFCDVALDEFYPCTSANQYNYWRGAPCVFLKLSDILNWKPEPYNNTDDLPADMPQDLKMHISALSGKPEANTVWVTCEGENPADKEFIGPVQYIPRRGFPLYYYPYTNQKGYLSPLVAVYFQRPTTGVLINIECRVWVKNFTSEGSSRLGSVHFELMVD